MKAFESYLKSKNYSPRTIKDDCQNVTRFLNWFNTADKQEQAGLTVAELVEYINVLQSNQISTQVINGRLRSIRKYCNYLQSEGFSTQDLDTVKVKGTVKKVVIDPLDYSDLEQLYNDYSSYRKLK